MNSIINQKRKGMWLAAAVLLLAPAIKAQNRESADLPVKWNGSEKVTLVKDLGSVWIIRKNGDKIKNVRIWDIQRSSERLVYEKDGSLHDLNISAIYRITPGKHPLHFMYFDGSNFPKIENNDESVDEFVSLSDFKVSYINKPVIEEKKQEAPEVKEIKNEEVLLNGKDTVIRGNKIIPAKICLIGPEDIRYKRADVPDGPMYTVKNGPDTQIKRYNDHVTIIIKDEQ